MAEPPGAPSSGTAGGAPGQPQRNASVRSEDGLRQGFPKEPAAGNLCEGRCPGDSPTLLTLEEIYWRAIQSADQTSSTLSRSGGLTILGEAVSLRQQQRELTERRMSFKSPNS
ncbi:unnamed protein product [Coccothraustes coccothraustes]